MLKLFERQKSYVDIQSKKVRCNQLKVGSIQKVKNNELKQLRLHWLKNFRFDLKVGTPPIIRIIIIIIVIIGVIGIGVGIFVAGVGLR